MAEFGFVEVLMLAVGGLLLAAGGVSFGITTIPAVIIIADVFGIDLIDVF